MNAQTHTETHLIPEGRLTVTRSGPTYPSSRIRFQLNALSVTRDVAVVVQRRFGYDPAGYGLSDFISLRTYATWSCANSCD